MTNSKNCLLYTSCTSESELLDTPVENSDLVPVTISLGSIQTKASVDLDAQEGNIENAVIGIFDSKGIPTTAPIVLKNGANTGTTRLPLVKSNAYAFAVSYTHLEHRFRWWLVLMMEM